MIGPAQLNCRAVVPFFAAGTTSAFLQENDDGYACRRRQSGRCLCGMAGQGRQRPGCGIGQHPGRGPECRVRPDQGRHAVKGCGQQFQHPRLTERALEFMVKGRKMCRQALLAEAFSGLYRAHGPL